MKVFSLFEKNVRSVSVSKVIITLIALSLCWLVYFQWSSAVVLIVEWQRQMHTALASHIQAVADDALTYGSALVGLSFVYGVFHAVGPGHGKAVMATYLGANRENIYTGVVIALVSAVLQSLVAIALVSVLAMVLKLKLSQIHFYGSEVTTASYILVVLLGALLIAGAVRRLLRLYRARRRARHTACAHSSHAHTHQHSASCSCKHAHMPEPTQTLWERVTLVLSMGLRPCSGAIVVLIYAHLVGVYSYGVLATLIMGLGTGLSVSLIALGTVFARTWVERLMGSVNGESLLSRPSVASYIRLCGGLILLALGSSLYSAAVATGSAHPLY